MPRAKPPAEPTEPLEAPEPEFPDEALPGLEGDPGDKGDATEASSPPPAPPVAPKRERTWGRKGPAKPKPSQTQRVKAQRERAEMSNAQLVAQLEMGLEKVGALLTVAGQMKADPRLLYDGEVFIARAKPVAAELGELAKRNPQLERALRAMFTGGDLTRAVLVFGSLVVPILASHGVIPEATFAQLGPILGAPPLPPRVPSSPPEYAATNGH